MSNVISRRLFLQAGVGTIYLSTLGLRSIAREKLNRFPFALGVASGAPLPHGVVLWTRIAADSVANRPADKPIALRWEVARDEHFKNIEQSGTVETEPQFAHSIHLEVNGLHPSQWYWYRFLLGDAVSSAGRTRTAPETTIKDNQLSFAFASCQRYDTGYYNAHRHMCEQDLDLVMFLGDYIYEKPMGTVRKVSIPEARNIEHYRALYELYKSDPDLQKCHAMFPWIVTWDDHEVANDYANDRSEKLENDFLTRRTAAYQAYYEHMPLRRNSRPSSVETRIYQNFDFGGLLRVHVLDDRQYRDYQFDPAPNRGGSNMIMRTKELAHEKRTLLGWEQEKWLHKSITKSNAIWDVIAQQTLVAQHILPDGKVWTDAWDGYPAARRRLMESIMQKPAANALLVGGDVHSYIVSDLKLDFDDPKSRVVASEVCGTSISSPGLKRESKDVLQKLNPHIKLFRSDLRGFVSVSLNSQQAEVKLQAVDTVTTQDSKLSTLASFEIKKGKPGFY